MEPTQLQLALNIVTITGVASLAGYCYLLKKELAAQRTYSQTDAPESEAAPSEPKTVAAPVAAVEQDIRNFAAGRRARWVQRLASSL